MNWNNFTLGFWHTFGPHGGETTEQILDRKAEEIHKTGYTLWSFQHRTRNTLQEWFRLIEAAKSNSIYVICSDSPGAKDGAGIVNYCTDYLPPHTNNWEAIPSTIKIPHPFNKTSNATAFVVKQIIRPEEIHTQPAFSVEWFSQGHWRTDRVPTKGVYLIKPGGEIPLRRTGAVLELQSPYVVSVRAL